MKTAERIQQQISEYKIAHNIKDNVPPDKDHLQSLNIDEDKAIVIDRNGNELCRFFVTIAGRKLFFRFPIFDKYDKFLKRFAELCQYLSRCIPNVELTDDNVELFKNPIAKSLWAEATGISVAQSKRVRELIIDMFFNHLGAYVENIKIFERKFETEKRFTKRLTKAHIKWFRENATMDKIQHILYACFAVDELIKKKATIGGVIKNHPPHLPEQNSENTSAQKAESTPKNSEVIQFSSLKLL
jgi:hypothetical protein